MSALLKVHSGQLSHRVQEKPALLTSLTGLEELHLSTGEHEQLLHFVKFHFGSEVGHNYDNSCFRFGTMYGLALSMRFKIHIEALWLKMEKTLSCCIVCKKKVLGKVLLRGTFI